MTLESAVAGIIELAIVAVIGLSCYMLGKKHERKDAENQLAKLARSERGEKR